VRVLSGDEAGVELDLQARVTHNVGVVSVVSGRDIV
jgi:hypothetical protein